MSACDRVLEAVRAAADAGKAVDAAWPAELDEAAAVHVLAFGKASVPMATAAVNRIGARCASGIVCGPPELVDDAPECLRAFACDHPEPTQRNVRAAEAVEAWARALEPGAPVLVLISGGGSAHLTLPRHGVTLDDCARVTRELNAAGASIAELNAVRAQAERLKGGGLSRAFGERPLIALIVSDVIGDDPRVIASGPLSAPSSATNARAVLDHFGVSPGSVLEGRLADGPAIARDVRIVLNNNAARDAVVRAFGRGARVTGAPRTGDARAIAQAMAAQWRSERGGALVWGGEATVQARGGGRGGPVQEMVLTLALALVGEPVRVLGFATDGIDGPTDAAGAWTTSSSESVCAQRGVDARGALDAHDSYRALGAAGALLRTGPTGTNVNDVVAVSAGPGGCGA